MMPYPQADDLLGPVRWVQMPRAPRLHSPGSTVHIVARCNNRAFSFTTREDFAVVAAHLYSAPFLLTGRAPWGKGGRR